MKGGDYFAYAAELLKIQPPHLTDEPIIAQMKRIGIEPVSYTHLDVYKRQQLSHRTPPNLPKSVT